MSESTGSSATNSGSITDNNSGGSRTPTPPSPSTIEDKSSESIVRIIPHLGSNISDLSTRANDAREIARMVQSNQRAFRTYQTDHDLYKESTKKLNPPGDIMYTRSISGMSDAIGNKGCIKEKHLEEFKLNGLTAKDRSLYQDWMKKSPEELKDLLEKGGSVFHSSDNGSSMTAFVETESNETGEHSHEYSNVLDYGELSDVEISGVYLGSDSNNDFISGAFSITANGDDEEEERESSD